MSAEKKAGNRFVWLALACLAVLLSRTVRRSGSSAQESLSTIHDAPPQTHRAGSSEQESFPEIQNTPPPQRKTLGHIALGAVVVSSSIVFALMYFAVSPGTSIMDWLIFALVALVGVVFLAGTLSEPASRASIGAQLCGGALVAGALLVIQADTSRIQQSQSEQQKVLDDKRAFISSLAARRDLSGLTFAGRDLSGGFLGLLSFKGSVFQGANLAGASFRCSNLTGARFANNRNIADGDVNQYGDILEDATVSNTDFTGANLLRAQLSNINLSSSGLDFSILQDANLSSASLPKDLVNVSADGANLTDVNADNSQWSNVSLRGADLRRAKLVNAGLGGTDPPSAVYNEDAYGPVDLRGADLRGANLTGAFLKGTLLTGAIADDSTHWPAGFDPKKAGVVSGVVPNVPESRLIPLPNSGCP
ncbi:MAG: pentapeptide repeat-containing protein [Pseudonocardiaceae bacterium]